MLAAVAAWQSRVQPVAPNLSYDELVVAEANRRIEEEKLREIALAEKKRFDNDVAERIALQKNPNHVTREMVAERVRERERLDKLAAEEQRERERLARMNNMTSQQILMSFEQKNAEIKAEAEAKAKAEADAIAKDRAETVARHEAAQERRRLNPTPEEQWEDALESKIKNIRHRPGTHSQFNRLFSYHGKNIRREVRHLAQGGKSHIEIAACVDGVNPKHIMEFFTFLANNGL